MICTEIWARCQPIRIYIYIEIYTYTYIYEYAYAVRLQAGPRYWFSFLLSTRMVVCDVAQSVILLVCVHFLQKAFFNATQEILAKRDFRGSVLARLDP